MSKEEQSGQSSWSKEDRGRGEGREVRTVVEGSHLKVFASGSEEMGTLTGWWTEELQELLSLVLCWEQTRAKTRPVRRPFAVSSRGCSWFGPDIVCSRGHHQMTEA